MLADVGLVVEFGGVLTLGGLSLRGEKKVSGT